VQWDARRAESGTLNIGVQPATSHNTKFVFFRS
jgi:hypothetical protein